MSQISRINLEREVRNIVAQIPRGYVLTYGRIAELAGWPRHARLVGNIMLTQDDALLPCHPCFPQWGDPNQGLGLQADSVQ